MNLLVLVVTLNGCSCDFVDPRLLPLPPTSCRDERGGVRSRDLDLSFLLERPLCSADGCGSADGDEGFISENSSSGTFISIWSINRLSLWHLWHLCIRIFAHAIQTVPVAASLLMVTDNHRHHSMNRNKLRLGW